MLLDRRAREGTIAGPVSASGYSIADAFDLFQGLLLCNDFCQHGTDGSAAAGWLPFFHLQSQAASRNITAIVRVLKGVGSETQSKDTIVCGAWRGALDEPFVKIWRGETWSHTAVINNAVYCN